jgi:hypothetical protein
MVGLSVVGWGTYMGFHPYHKHTNLLQRWSHCSSEECMVVLLHSPICFDRLPSSILTTTSSEAVAPASLAWHRP